MNDIIFIILKYEGNDVLNNIFYVYDFDLEVMVKYGDDLFFFFKSWKIGIIYIYKVNEDEVE